jgi:talin
MGRKTVSDLLYICRGAFGDDHSSQHDNDYQHRVLSVGLNCAMFYKELLDCVQGVFGEGAASEAVKQQLLAQSKNISGSVADLLAIAEILKSADQQEAHDPTVLAENELLGAADAIESAARRLSSLQPRTKAGQSSSVSESLNFDEQILEAAKSITNAAGVLIKAATAAQKELVAQGKATPSASSSDEDGQWSQGLISAARLVAAACHTLCEAANGLVQGHATEDRLISSAKQVASSTAALLVACKVKAEITSQAMKRLQHAGKYTD